ncbi:hypothetical protein LUZ60_004801 [Juncus effusus]|nr:hypothetical protein LUZ60_004801 [Juncus effusus]
MASPKNRVETWLKDQTSNLQSTWQNPALPTWRGWQWQWPWRGREEERKRLREEIELRRNQLMELCKAVKAESVADLQEVLSSMVLAECVYKRPVSEMMKYINKFKSDFGGQIVSIERVQPSLDHVSHRYLLAEDGDTLFASFIGTKQYRDIFADMNILQGAIFHEEASEYLDMVELNEENANFSPSEKPKQFKKSKPAAHKGFLARAKGIPALELYNLAIKKNRKLVLCGHSLGGAVAVLATLAILRVVAHSKENNNNNGKLQVKCITFSQPPVGNEALKDYVHQKGWENYFKSYCIPEDLVPRILSPAYFHHYNNTTQTLKSDSKPQNSNPNSNSNSNLNEPPLVLGLGPVQTSFWRLSKLVPIQAVTKNLNKIRNVGNVINNNKRNGDGVMREKVDEEAAQSLEIFEGSEGISLTPLPDTDARFFERKSSKNNNNNNNIVNGSNNNGGGIRVPSLPSYVPFGQLYLLGDASVKSLSDSEYSKMTSVRTVITELKDRLQSHSMRSYRSRFQKIYESCMCATLSPFPDSQLPQLSHLQQLLGLQSSHKVELGHVVAPPVIRAATSLVPLGWTGQPGDKSSEPLKVDVVGHGLHLCSLVQAYLNGNWCSTAVEALPPDPEHLQNRENTPELQKMRILVGAPLKKAPKYPINEDFLLPVSLSPISDDLGSLFEERSEKNGTDGFEGFAIYCTSDFVTVRKEVCVRTRRVRLLGLEGSGKTSLFRAILSQTGDKNIPNLDCYSHIDSREGISRGLCYLDSTGLNLQDLNSELARFKEELQAGSKDLTKKTDLIILVHNLSHKIPTHQQNPNSGPNPNFSIPSLSLLLNEVKSLQIPWILSITNKYSVSADQQEKLIKYSIEAYKASPNLTAVVNSNQFFINGSLNLREASRRILSFKKEMVMDVEGVGELRKIVHGVLRNNEELAFRELAEERLSQEVARERELALKAKNNPPKKENNPITAAAIGASLGAGLGLVMAVVMGAASALRKP